MSLLKAVREGSETIMQWAKECVGGEKVKG